MAARTKQPAATYPALDGLTLNECLNVGRPWQLQPKANTYVEQWKPGKPERTDRWTELHVWTGPKGGPSLGSLLLYSLHAAYRPPHEQYPIWYQLTPLATDYPFMVALLPQYPAPLYWHIIRLAATRDAADAGCRNVLTQAMRSLLLPGPAFEEAATDDTLRQVLDALLPAEPPAPNEQAAWPLCRPAGALLPGRTRTDGWAGTPARAAGYCQPEETCRYII